jgi:hypothetical protein
MTFQKIGRLDTARTPARKPECRTYAFPKFDLLYQNKHPKANEMGSKNLPAELHAKPEPTGYCARIAKQTIAFNAILGLEFSTRAG